MLDIKTSDNPTVDSPTSFQLSVEEMNEPLFGNDLGNFSDMLSMWTPLRRRSLTDPRPASPEFQDVSDVQHTPWLSPNGSDTPFSDFLTTPLLGLDETSPEFASRPLFPPTHSDTVQPQALHEPVKATLDLDTLYKLTPVLEPLDAITSIQPSALAVAPAPAPVPEPEPVIPAPSTRSASRRRNGATGIRKGITPDNLLDEDAPTQPRKYVTPSATSKKAVPAVFARKRARSTAFPEEEDQLDDLAPDAGEMDVIEQKRRQNTVAARRSRKRKLEYYQALERGVVAERQLKETWKERTALLLGLLRSAGMNLPDFPPDPPSDPLLENLP